MPIYNGTSTKNQGAIYTSGNSVGKVYVGDKLVWQKPTGIFYPVKYGRLYNWYVVTDARNIAASGYHVATVTEYESLRTYLNTQGYLNLEGKVLKEIGDTYWFPSLLESTNIYGFNWRGAGFRSNTGTFTGLGNNGQIWTTTQYDVTYAYLFQTSRTVNTANTVFDRKTSGRSIRIIKDSTTLSNGQSGTYTGNDGKIYRTICINGKEYTADNIAETKYRNGDSIPIVTDNTAWAALTTGAMCSYNNDDNNI